jgi:hypothetical protein
VISFILWFRAVLMPSSWFVPSSSPGAFACAAAHGEIVKSVVRFFFKALPSRFESSGQGHSARFLQTCLLKLVLNKNVQQSARVERLPRTLPPSGPFLKRQTKTGEPQRELAGFAIRSA